MHSHITTSLICLLLISPVACTNATRPDTTDPQPGAVKMLPETAATRDAATGPARLFEPVHAPAFTEVREGLNGWVFGDVDGNGYLDIFTVTTPPFALDTMPEFTDTTGNIERTRDPIDRLRLYLNHGGFRMEQHDIELTGSPATPADLSQGWRGGQVPALADFDDDGFYDLFISRQTPIRGGRPIPGKEPVGNSLFISNGAFHRFEDVSREYGVLNDKAYNRQVSLGDLNLDGFLDIATGADNVVNAFEGLPISALFVFRPNDGAFAGGRFEDIGGTDLVPDFGGFYHDSARDRAGPNIVLRDLDNDGDLDLAQGNHLLVIGRTPPLNRLPYSPAEYRHGFFNWQNRVMETGEFRFEKITDNGFADVGRFRYDREMGKLVPVGDERAPAITHLFYGDVNNDGTFDAIAVTGMNPVGRPATEPVAARFWYNLGDFQFRVATKEAGLDVLNNKYRFWMDFFGEQPAEALENIDPEPLPSQPGLEPWAPLDQFPRYSDLVFADFDNDGWLDFVVFDRMISQLINGRSILFMNRGDGTFEPKPTSFSGISRTSISAEAADLDNDGLVDLVVSADPDNTGVTYDAREFETTVFRNTGAHGGRDNHWLRLRFSGVSDARLIGTRIVLRERKTGRILGTRGVYSNHTYKSSSALEAHFGLGKTRRVDMEIFLPGGQELSIDNVKADRYVDVDLRDGKYRVVRTRPTN